jgi:hypothetical protein
MTMPNASHWNDCLVSHDFLLWIVELILAPKKAPGEEPVGIFPGKIEPGKLLPLL